MRRTLLVLAILVPLLALAAYGLFRWVSSPPGSGRTVELPVPRGIGARGVAELLADSGLVRSSHYVLWRYSRMEGKPPLQAGRYLLSDTMQVDSILSRLASGRVMPVPTHWVAIPEGLRMDTALALLSDSLDIPLPVLDSLARDSAFLEDLGVPCLEGYLYPETYELADTLSPRQVISRIVRTGLSRWEPAEGAGRHRTVILASIVEREARVDEERALIAGVFANRLRRGMKLESCATVQYALGEVRDILLYSDLGLDSPYNTYIHEGLPPGPICSPGRKALEAAVSPDTSEGYLYFVSRGDGSGRHLFARTHAEHARNIRSVR
ncbi:MAG: endolytic transglycosylase MltG [Candidatus Fermentibacteraceae bacterium]